MELHGGRWSSVEVPVEVREGFIEASMAVHGDPHGALWRPPCSLHEGCMEVRGDSMEAFMELRGGLHGGPWRLHGGPWRLVGSLHKGPWRLGGGLHGGSWRLHGVPDNVGHRLYVMTRHGCCGTRFRFVGVHHRQSMLLTGLHCQHRRLLASSDIMKEYWFMRELYS